MNMNVTKDELVIEMAKCLLELSSLDKSGWNISYYRFAENSRSHFSCQWVIRSGRLVYFSDLELDDASSFMRKLEVLAEELHDQIEKDDNPRPKVTVLKVDSNNDYNIKFDYESSDALDIEVGEIGSVNSYFLKGEVDIPDYIAEYLNEIKSEE